MLSYKNERSRVETKRERRTTTDPKPQAEAGGRRFDDCRTSDHEAAWGSDGRNVGASVVDGGMRKL